MSRLLPEHQCSILILSVSDTFNLVYVYWTHMRRILKFLSGDRWLECRLFPVYLRSGLSLCLFHLAHVSATTIRHHPRIMNKRTERQSWNCHSCIFELCSNLCLSRIGGKGTKGEGKCSQDISYRHFSTTLSLFRPPLE